MLSVHGTKLLDVCVPVARVDTKWIQPVALFETNP